MSGNDLPENDHVVRYVKPSSIEPGRVSITEFRLHEDRADGEGVPVNWLECYKNLSKEKQLAEVRRGSRLRLRKNGRFAELKQFQQNEEIVLQVIRKEDATEKLEQ